MMRPRSHDLDVVITNVEALDNFVRNLAANLKTLTADFHAIRQTILDIKPWPKVISFMLGFHAGVFYAGHSYGCGNRLVSDFRSSRPV